jgi:protein involved in polysaccharide export with SLBB domain
MAPACRHGERPAAVDDAPAEAAMPEVVAPAGVLADDLADPAVVPAVPELAAESLAEAPVAMAETPPPAVPLPYLLRVGDALEISVLDEPEMFRDNVVIIPDGTITYLLTGEVPAAGRTVGEVRAAIAAALEAYFVDPRVSVILRTLAEPEPTPEELVGPDYVAIIGALRDPGKYEMTQGYRLLDLIADAGGMLYSRDEFGSRAIANLKSAYISRDGKMLDVDFDRLLRLGDMSQNIVLAPHDFVYVPDAETDNIYVLGEVRSPRPIPFVRDITLIEAVAMCGGFTEVAQRSGVMIIRPSTGTNFEINLERLLLGQEELNLPMENGDIVFVPEQGLSEYARYARYLTDFANLVLSGYQVREAVRFPKLKRGEAP